MARSVLPYGSEYPVQLQWQARFGGPFLLTVAADPEEHVALARSIVDPMM
jgi:hypothetical protein